MHWRSLGTTRLPVSRSVSLVHSFIALTAPLVVENTSSGVFDLQESAQSVFAGWESSNEVTLLLLLIKMTGSLNQFVNG